jgi:Ca-activated chloride channel homolog
LKIYTIGVGTPQGDLIPLPANQGSGFVKDDSGAFVKSKLDEPSLKAIAAATGGLYAPLGAQGQGFETIYKAGLAPMLKHDVASRRQKIYTERYQWPLAGSLGLLLSSLLIGNRRRVRGRRRAPASESRVPADATRLVPKATAVSGAILLSLSLLPPGPARASTTTAEDAYKKGDFATAEREYAAAAQRDPKKPVLQFNAGTAAYRAGQFPQAAQAFQESISRAPSGDAKRLADQEDAYYNLGNTLYRTGQKTEESSPQQTMQTWKQAVKAYETALQLRPDDADSKFNRDFVKRKIQDLNQQQPPQNQNQQQNQPNNQQQNKQPGQSKDQPPNQPPNQPQNPPPNPQQNPPQNPPPPPKGGGTPPGQQPPPPGQPPPGQPPPAQPPPSANQPPPGADPPKPDSGQPKPAPGNGEPPPQEAEDKDDAPAPPGQMSREEARQLLDSQKGDERHALGLPSARREADTPPEKPLKDW